MDAACKRQMSIGRAAYVEFIRRGELLGVAIGGANAESDLGSRRQIHAAELYGLSRNAIAELVRTFVAQELLDGALDQACIGNQSISLIGMLCKRDQSVADQVRRRFMTCIQQKYAVVNQLRSAQGLAVVPTVQKARYQIGIRSQRRLAAALDQFVQIRGEFPYRTIAPAGRVGSQARLQRPQYRKRPIAQRRAFCTRYTQQIADDFNRYGGGKVLDEIDRSLGCHGVDQAVHQRDEVRLDLRNGTRRQGSIDEPAHPGMKGRAVEHKARRVVSK